MDWSGALKERLTGLNVRPEREAEIIDELSQHLDDQVRELAAGGAGLQTARTIALNELDARLADTKVAGTAPTAPAAQAAAPARAPTAAQAAVPARATAPAAAGTRPALPRPGIYLPKQ